MFIRLKGLSSQWSTIIYSLNTMVGNICFYKQVKDIHSTPPSGTLKLPTLVYILSPYVLILVFYVSVIINW